jgi:hypothetical protein
MPSIIANPTAVGFWSTTDIGTTKITWNGKPSPDKANLFRSDNGAAEKQIDGPADSGVTTDTDLHLGHTYTYILRNAKTNTQVGTVTVTTYDVHENFEPIVVNNILAAALPPPQEIFNLTITPGVDSARLSFRTVQPTVPVITLTPKGGTPFKWAPFFGGLQTNHEFVLGGDTPLAQKKVHVVEISASGKKPDGTPMKALASGNFITGSRDVTVIFDSIKVRNDSDLLSAGEITFTFQAGDADTGEVLGEQNWPETAISSDDPPLAINRSIVIPNAPRALWVQVVGRDDDTTLWQGPSGVPVLFPTKSFVGEGTHEETTQFFDISWVARVIDISEITSKMSLPISLLTGDFNLAFTVIGRVLVDATIQEPSTERKLPPFELKPSFNLNVPGSVKHAGHINGDFGHLVGLGADGTTYHKLLAQTGPNSRDENWTQLGEPVMTPIKGLPRSDGGLDLFAFDREGGLLYQSIKNGQETRWQQLGGRFQGPVAVAEGPEGEVETFGLGEDGVVYHQAIRVDGKGKRDDWQRVGAGVSGSVSAEAFADGTVGVFAIGQNGQVLHKRRRRNQWSPSGLEWEILGKAIGPQLLVLHPVPDKGVGLATLSNDGAVEYLIWPDYPEGKPPRRWKSMGTIDAWLAALPKRVGRSKQKAPPGKKKLSRKKRRTTKP